jgi:hypothetical protein
MKCQSWWELRMETKERQHLEWDSKEAQAWQWEESAWSKKLHDFMENSEDGTLRR